MPAIHEFPYSGTPEQHDQMCDRIDRLRSGRDGLHTENTRLRAATEEVAMAAETIDPPVTDEIVAAQLDEAIDIPEPEDDQPRYIVARFNNRYLIMGLFGSRYYTEMASTESSVHADQILNALRNVRTPGQGLTALS